MFLKCSHWAYFTFLLSGIFTYFSQLDSDFCQSLGVEISSFIWMDCLVLLSFSWAKAMVLIPCFFDLNLEWGGRCSYLVCAHHLAIREQSILKSTITWKCSSGQKECRDRRSRKKLGLLGQHQRHFVCPNGHYCCCRLPSYHCATPIPGLLLFIFFFRDFCIQ